MSEIKIQQIDACRWRLPMEGKMRTEGVIYLSEEMIEKIRRDASLAQVANVAWLPGIVGYSLAMPDIHLGYGFAIGGVAAFDVEEGIISPGGVGYDINCGVRLLRSDLTRQDLKPRIKELITTLFSNVPSGVGSHRKDLKLNLGDQKEVLKKGARWAVENGYGSPQDLEHIEEKGSLPGADPELVSQRALERGRTQLGTLGSGNHFVEVGFVEEIYQEEFAKVLGLKKDQLTIVIHTGSRGLGYQVCDDYIKIMLKASQKYGIELPDKQLCCAPIHSEEGRNYFSAMACAANYAFANRQMIAHWVRESLEKTFKRKDLGLKLVYDVAHNIAKFETHRVKGAERRVCVHRKGATRAFPPHHPDTPSDYQRIGQPVLIPGDMGRYSYVLVGTERAMEETFGSTCHGAGRLLSRHQAQKTAKGRAILQELEDKGITIKAAGRDTIAEEIPEAYKDVAQVVDVVQQAGISQKVAKLRPIGVIKG